MRKLIPGIVAVTLLGGCSSMSIQTDFSQEADFDRFKTFQYAASDNTIAAAAPLVDERIVAAIRREMIASGLTETETNPDVYVSYYASIDEQLQFHTTHAGGAGWGRRGRASVGLSTSSTRASTFEEGTLVIDIWQAEEDQLVWRGVISDTLSSNAERNREMVNRGISRAFEAFPPS